MSSFRADAKRFSIAFVLSAVFHGLVALGAFLYVLASAPPFEFEDPTEIELGLMDEIEVDAPTAIEEVPEPPPTTPVTPPANADDPETEVAADAGLVDDDASIDAGTDAEIADADTDAEVDAALDAAADGEMDAGVADAEAGIEDAGVDAAPLVASASATDGGTRSMVGGPSRLPAGAMIAIRVDLAKVRGGYLERPVRDLIATIPEWSMLLEGSGVVPMDDFDQLFLASANPQDFAQIAIAGRHRHDPNWVRARAEELARLRGQTIEWTRQQGVLRAPWWAQDGRPRIVAILGPQHFAVCREADLPRLLLIAQHRARRPSSDGVVMSGPDALLSMGENEVLSLEAENIGRYVRSAPGALPMRGSVAVAMSRTDVSIEGLATYADAETAATGSEEWKALVRRFGGIIGQRFAEGMRFTPEGERVHVSAGMDEAQSRRLLGLLQMAFGMRRERQHLPPARLEP